MNSATGSSTAETFKPSEYTSHFNSRDIELYIKKLNRLNITDPYNVPGVLFKSISAEEDVPDLRYPDIYNFLINFPSCYSGDSLKAYKSLEGYKWTQSGFVTNIQLWNLQAKNIYIITGRVHHSQRLNDPQLKPWVVARKDGVVLGAHCNCTAGLGESCSHVSAVLFSLWQHTSGKQEEIAVTSKKCKWAIPSEECLKKVEYQQCKDIIFNNSKQNKKEKSSKDRPDLPAFPPLTAAEQDQLYHNLSQCRTQEGQIFKPVVLSVIREYAASYIPKAVMLDLPQPLTSLYDKQARDLNLAVLQDRAEALFENITVTKEQSDIVEEETRAQSKSKIWFEQRSGRVTGSTFRAATKTDIRKPAVSLIRQICYPRSHSFTNEATRWGCKHEDMVRNYYEMQHRLSHADVVVGPAGFRISPLHPFIGASPDGYVSCSCCGSELDILAQEIGGVYHKFQSCMIKHSHGEQAGHHFRVHHW
ncbi:hypothetical protein WMY93_024605 [Mugilogobius chulae]|uniref:YqaJ viral recombinase domain-containing protein n=1 Tax=Mugilogobius chulae TaxID=88201 RepID=A0AAW0N021_9GOBI